VQQDHSVLSQTQRNGYSLGASWTKTKESRIVCQSYLETSISAENGKTTRKLFSRNFYRCLGRWPTKLWSTKKKKKKKIYTVFGYAAPQNMGPQKKKKKKKKTILECWHRLLVTRELAMTLTLFCIVDGESTPFSVVIDVSKTVDHLKETIKGV
jgi:hypothetical protein